MITLWQSEDGYVRAVDGVEFPDEEAPETRGDLDTLFRAEAWIVVWRGPDLRWRFTRNRRYAKPGLQALRRIMQRADMPGAQDIWIASTDAHGHILEESTLAPTALAQSLYAAWQKLAVAALPAKIAFLQLNPDDYEASHVPAWMRPGIPLHRERRAFLREAYEDFGVQLAG